MPALYSAETRLYEGDQLKDLYTTPFGIRSIEIIPNKGFFLNGEHLKLKGVCRHQDRAERGNALYKMHHDEDAAIMVEMGLMPFVWLIIRKRLTFMT